MTTRARITKLADDRHSTRVRYGSNQRATFTIALSDPAAAQRRADLMADVAARLTSADLGAHAEPILKKLGSVTSDAEVAALRRLVDGMLAGRVVADDRRLVGVRTTFGMVASRWTSGELHKSFPDHIRRKRSVGDDVTRLGRYILPVLGDLPIGTVTLDHCQDVMSRLPAGLAPQTRRNIARTMSRVFTMAVFPLRLISASPIPRGFVPAGGDRKALGYLYPDEDRRLMAAATIPLCYRLLWGFFCREGMRESEAIGLTWADLDLERGAVRLDVNKTDDPRAWALDPGVVAALQAWRSLRPDEEPGHLVFTDEFGRTLRGDALCKLLHKHLRAIGLADERPELFTSTAQRLRIRVHDLRGTFVTVSLAQGRSEAWVSDRTGHRSSQMIARYKRQARTFGELGLGGFESLALAIPECAAVVADSLAEGLRALDAAPFCPGGVGRGWAGSSAPGTNRTCDPRFRKPLLYPLSYGGRDCFASYRKFGRSTARLLPRHLAMVKRRAFSVPFRSSGMSRSRGRSHPR